MTEINKTINFRQELRTDDGDSDTTYVIFNGMIDANGISSIDYYLNADCNQAFLDNQQTFRKALVAFQTRVWDETDAFLEQLALQTPEDPEPTEGDDNK